MAKSKVKPGRTRQRLVASLVSADSESLARESTSHADAIARLETQVGTLQDANTATVEPPPGSVLASDYGILADGVTDDRPALQTLLDNIAKTTAGSYGGAVILPKGTVLSGNTVYLPNGCGLFAYPTATEMKASNSFAGTTLVTNKDRLGNQEYAFLTGIRFNGNGKCTDAVVSFVSLFINSYIRDCVILGGANIGLRVTATNGMGPIEVRNTWALHNGGHNIYIDEQSGNSNACAGILFDNVTSENWGNNSSAFYLKGIGASGNYRFTDLHMEHGGVGATGLTGITLDGVSHVRIANVQLQAGIPSAYTQGIRITSSPQNVDIEIDDVTNINIINPVLVDDAYGATLGGVNINRYVTPDVTTIGGQRFAPGTASAVANFPNKALSLVTQSGGNEFAAIYPGLGGGALRWRYISSGTAGDIVQWGTDATSFWYQLMTLQNGLRGFASRLSAPSSGTHLQGEVVFNANAIAGDFVGWVCVAAGTPGTWKAFGAIQP